MGKCELCPLACGVDRTLRPGACGEGSKARIARAALHHFEEPPLVTRNGVNVGSGAVFFSGCPLRCPFCQNDAISHGGVGTDVSTKRLSEIFFKLENEGAANINLVSASHFVPQILEAAKIGFPKIPALYNSSGYENVETLKMLDGFVKIYRPDFKYMDEERGRKYSGVGNYPETAKKALAEMVSQAGKPRFVEDGSMQSGVIVRLLLLPKGVKDAKAVIEYVYKTYGDDVYLSIMSQYTPPSVPIKNLPELSRRVTRREYDKVVDYALSLGVTNAYVQDRSVATESFIPDFAEGI